MLDGKNKAVVISDLQGRTIARCVLRLLIHQSIDSEEYLGSEDAKPVLCVFRSYFAAKHGTHEQELRRCMHSHAARYARDLGVPIAHCTSAARPESCDCDGRHTGAQGVLHSLGGVSPEYVDDGDENDTMSATFQLKEWHWLVTHL